MLLFIDKVVKEDELLVDQLAGRTTRGHNYLGVLIVNAVIH